MTDERNVVQDVIEESPKPDSALDPLPDVSELERKPKKVRKPRKAR
jgi:hypothetical protein